MAGRLDRRLIRAQEAVVAKAFHLKWVLDFEADLANDRCDARRTTSMVHDFRRGI
jgi:hypothetical protein